MRLAAASVLLPLVASVASAEVAVRVSAGSVDLTATAAPLADVLDRLSRQTGMKVVYEGPAPRQLVTVSLHGRTPAETILAVFEGLGLNYAMVADSTGAGVQTLMVAGAAGAGAAPVSATARPAVNGMRRPFGPPPGSSPEAMEPGFDEGDQEAEGNDLDLAGMLPGPEAQDAGAAQPPGAPPANGAPQNANPGGPPQGTPPPQLSMPFSASPFTPQPQPFPPPQAQPPQPQANPQPDEENKPQAAPPQ